MRPVDDAARSFSLGEDVRGRVTSVFADVRVVLCDADGNLFPSEEPAFVASVQVTNAFLAEYGVNRRYEADELRLATTGMNFRTTLVALALEHGIPVAPELVSDSAVPAGSGHSERASEVVTADVVNRWVDREQRAVTEHLRTVLEPDPDVLSPLAQIADRFGVAAVSSSADARIAACFEATGMARYFPPDRRFSAEDSLPRPTSKPDPAIYRYAGQVLGIGPAEGVAVEDSLAGATSAIAAGFATIGLLQFVQPAERADRRTGLTAAGVSAVVGSWAEVLALLPRRGAGS